MGDRQALIRRVEESAGLQRDAFAGGLHDLVNGERVRAEALRIDEDLQLPIALPQIATLATPGIDISRGLIVHFASVVSSTCVSVSEVMPTFMTRLSDDNGESITGERATPGSCAAVRDNRSCTIWRAAITLPDGSRMSTT